MWKKLLAVLVLSCLWSVYAGASSSDIEYTDLSVKFVDENDIPIEFVTLSVYSPGNFVPHGKATTMHDGVAHFDKLQIAMSGQVFFFARMTPYMPENGTLRAGMDTVFISEPKRISVTKPNKFKLVYKNSEKMYLWKLTGTYFENFYIHCAAAPYNFVKFRVSPNSSIIECHMPMNKMYQVISSDSDLLVSDQIIWWSFFATPELIVTM